MHGFSYEEPAFHLADSRSYLAFCGLGIDEKSPRKSALQNNIKRIRPETLETINLVRRVMEQTERRVFRGEKVPAEEKVVSIFEDHTDIIVDCVVEDGNPADTTLAVKMIDRQRQFYGRLPRQAEFDGGFASKDILKALKKAGVKDVAFAKKRGLKIADLAKSRWVYKRLRDFRAGIEGMLSFLKRCFGAGRRTWRGHESFKSYGWGSVCLVAAHNPRVTCIGCGRRCLRALL